MRTSERPESPAAVDLERRATRLRARTWQAYLAVCRAAAPVAYEAAERDAWTRLQARLATIEEQLERARERLA